MTPRPSTAIVWGSSAFTPKSARERSAISLRDGEPVDVGVIAVSPKAVQTGYAQGRGEEIDRPAFERGDQNLSGLEYAFVRERIGSAAAISLVHRDLNERMPLVRTIWVQTFADERSRDGCFEWLSRRLDRWNVWGEVAYRTGAGALTQRLFSLLMFQMTEEPAAAGSEQSTATGRSDDAAPPLLSIEYRRY